MFERKHDKLVPLPQFARRMAMSLLWTWAILCVVLSGGVVGYHLFADLPWIDSLLNASMILTGMGPVDPMTTTRAKLFASGYALFSGVIFLSSIGLVLAPLFHRILHRFHLDDEEVNKEEKAKKA